MQVTKEGITFGAAVTLSALGETLRQQIKTLPPHQTASYRAMLHQLKYFAGTQIRNTASLGGGIVTGSPISDCNPLWMATRSVFTVIGEGTPAHEVWHGCAAIRPCLCGYQWHASIKMMPWCMQSSRDLRA